MVSRIVKLFRHNIGFEGNLHQQSWLEVESSTIIFKVLSYNACFQIVFNLWVSLFPQQNQMDLGWILLSEIQTDPLPQTSVRKCKVSSMAI